MAGVNQVIMLSLSMVVIAGLGGAPGLGRTVVRAVTSMNLGMGIEGGLGIVVLAIFLDRVTAAFGREGRGRSSASAGTDEASLSDDAPESSDGEGAVEAPDADRESATEPTDQISTTDHPSPPR